MNFKSLFLHKWHLTFYVCACMCGSGSNQCLLKTLSKEALFQHQVNTFWGNCPTSRKLLFPTFFSPGSYLLAQHDGITKVTNREGGHISNAEVFVWEYWQISPHRSYQRQSPHAPRYRRKALELTLLPSPQACPPTCSQFKTLPPSYYIIFLWLHKDCLWFWIFSSN